MKKPEITKGEWELNIGNEPLADTGDYISYAEIRGENGELIAQCHETRQIDIEHQQTNAKAIAQVPNLIDELIKYHKLLEWCKTNYPEWDMDKDLERCKNTLQKAGVEL